MIEKASTRLFQLFVLSILILTPVVYGTPTNEVFEFPKMTFLYVAISMLVFLFVNSVALTKTQQLSINKKWAVLMFTFLMVIALSTLLSSHIYTSLWGYYGRHTGGFFFFLTFVMLYFVLTASVSVEKLLYLLKIQTLVVIPISVLAIWQYFGPDNITRVYSTFGQPNWLAAYLVFNLALAWGYFVTSKNSGNKGESKNANKMENYFALICLIGFWALWLTFSMSGILGFIASIATLLIIFRKELTTNKAKLKKISAVGIGMLIIILVSPGIFSQRVKDIGIDIEKVHEAQTTSELQNAQIANSNNVSDAGYIRLNTWQGTSKLFLNSTKNFLVGTGPETFAYEFQAFRPTELNYSSEWDYIINKPHNYFLELASQTGLLSVILYLAILLLAFHTAYKTNHHGKKILLAPLVGMTVTNFFGWPSATLSLLFFYSLACLSQFPQKEPKKASKTNLEIPLNRKSKIGIFTAGLALSAFLIAVPFKYFLADIYYKSAESKLTDNRVALALQSINEAITLNSNEPEYHRTKSKILLAATVDKEDLERKELKEQALLSLETSLKLNPRNYATIRNNIPLYFFLANEDLTKSITDVTNSTAELYDKTQNSPHNSNNMDNIEKEYLEITKEYFRFAKNYAPNDVGIYILTAKQEKRLGLEEEYNNSVKNVERLRPDLLQWHPDLLQP